MSFFNCRIWDGCFDTSDTQNVEHMSCAPIWVACGCPRSPSVSSLPHGDFDCEAMIIRSYRSRTVSRTQVQLRDILAGAPQRGVVASRAPSPLLHTLETASLLRTRCRRFGLFCQGNSPSSKRRTSFGTNHCKVKLCWMALLMVN